MALSVVQQLRDLAAVPDNRHFIVRDHGCLPGLVSFVSSPEEDVKLVALQALEFLSEEPKNWAAMQAEEGMLDVLQKMADEEEDSVCKSRASNVLQNVRRMDTEGAMVTTVSIEGENSTQKENGLEFEETVITTTTKTTTTKRKIKAKGSVDADIRPLRTRNSAAGAPRSARKKRRPRTYTIYILGLGIETDREKVESALLARKGIISFLTDLTEQKAVVRAVISGEAVIETIANSGYEASFEKPEKPMAIIDFLDDDDDGEVDNGMSIVEHGATAQQEESGWMGWGSRLGRALWG